MILKNYQQIAVNRVQDFFKLLDSKKAMYASLTPELKSQLPDYLTVAYGSDPVLATFPDRPRNGAGQLYPRVCIKMPTGGGKTLVAIETIRSYQNLLAKRQTGLVVWITHREQIYRQTIENLQNKSHVYRQLLDQCSGNKTLILEKGRPIRQQDVSENLVVLMLMIQSAGRDTNKMFEDSGGYTDFFPAENRFDLHAELIKQVPNLDKTNPDLFTHTQVKTSLGNVIRTLYPLIIVDELHTMYTDRAKGTLDGLNPSAIVGLSATPKAGMNILVSVTGRQLNEEGMVKLDLHLIAPQHNADWQAMLVSIKSKRDSLETTALEYEKNTGIYIRPIALIQVERTGREQRGTGFVHSEDVRESLVSLGVPKHEIAVKSSSLDEIRQEKLLSKESEIRYIITKEALKEGWDCSFAYLLGVIPNAHSNTGMTQLVGRILRQPYAKKTGVADLDESYVYFSNGQTQDVLSQVHRGFSDEGLSDILSGVKTELRAGQPENPTKTVKIKSDLLNEYYHSLFLPVWLIKNGSGYRHLVYEIDISPKLDWSGFDIAKWIENIKPSLSNSQRPEEILIGLGTDTTRTAEEVTSASLDVHYLTRRITDVVNNAFLASEMASRFVTQLLKEVEQKLLNTNAGYIASLLVRELEKSKRDQEKKIFDSLMESGALKLTVTDEPYGFRMPENDAVTNQFPTSYRHNLYEDIEIGSLNSLEQRVVGIVDNNTHVLWWARNKAKRGWYAIQGWQKGKIRPDFIVAKKTEDNKLEFVYIIESKGEQLVGNANSVYKDEVLTAMTSLNGSIETVQPQSATYQLNDRFEFELVPQGEEERRIRTKLG